MQQKFIESVEAAYKTHDGFDWFEYAMNELPNCFAKGFIHAKMLGLVGSFNISRYMVKVSLLMWAKYDIWK